MNYHFFSYLFIYIINEFINFLNNKINIKKKKAYNVLFIAYYYFNFYYKNNNIYWYIYI